MTQISPLGIGLCVAAAQIVGRVIILFAFFAVPGLVAVSTIFSYVAGWGVFLAVLLVTGLALTGWPGIIAFFLGRFAAGAVGLCLEFWQVRRNHRLTGCPLTSSEVSFLNAYRFHASRIGITTDTALSDEEIDEWNWGPTFLRFAREWPEVVSRFSEDGTRDVLLNAKSGSPSTTASSEEPESCTEGCRKAKVESTNQTQSLRPAEEPVAADSRRLQRGNWIARHWRGDLPLAVSYWVNGLAVLIGSVAIALMIAAAMKNANSPYSCAAALITVWVAAFASYLWLWVGIWRSANRHMDRTGKNGWASVAQIMVVLGVLSFPSQFLTGNYGWPAINESFHEAAEIKGMSDFEIRPLRGGSEVEIAGGIGIGVSDALENALRANPNARVIHINSKGGLVEEGEKLGNLIRARGLTTYTSTECDSAATIAFLGGKERFIKKGAKLGFHQSSGPGLHGQALEARCKNDEQFLISMGVSADFARKALSTPSSGMWYPSSFELREAHVITGMTDGDEYGLSGIPDWNDSKKIESELLDLPLYQALKIHEPVAYQQVIAAFTGSISKGESLTELQARARLIVEEVAMRRIPMASDDALLAIWRVWISQSETLSAVSPDAVFECAFGMNDANQKWGQYLGEKVKDDELDALTQVIETADAARQMPSDAEIQPIIERVLCDAYESIGQDALLVAQFADEQAMEQVDRSKASKAFVAFYRAIMRQPKDDAALLLRYLSQEGAPHSLPGTSVPVSALRQ